MRIVAGKFRSRSIEAVKGNNTRPTLDKVKEAVYSMIGPYFDGGCMLDLFAGSGNMGLEALSRGFDEVIFVDKDYGAVSTIAKNCKSLDVGEHIKIWKMDYKTALKQCSDQSLKFDLIYLDPPYAKQKIDEILHFINEHELLNEQGRVIAESLKEDEFSSGYGNIRKIKESCYGITRITIYKKESQFVEQSEEL